MATNNPAQDKNKAPAIVQERSFLRDDFPAIRRVCLVFIACALIGTGLVSSTQYLLEQQLDVLNKARAKENQTREKYQVAAQERDEIHAFQPKYNELAEQGFVGTELRLNWVESIQAIQKKALLAPIDYEISEQVTFLTDPKVDTGTLELRGSKMHFKMNLRHEMDLLNFLNGLKDHQVNDLQNCSIRRWADPDPNSFAPLLEAECNLYWLTMGKRGGDTDDGAAQPVSPNPQGQ